MRILFLTLLDFDALEEQGIYTDLMRQFILHNHQVTIISPIERRKKEKTHLITKEELRILKLRIGNIQKTHLLEKGLSTLLLERQFIRAIKSYFSSIKFDIIIYSTPPITLMKVVEFVKLRDHAKSYLLLKDIFPQNALDLGILTRSGFKGILYQFFKDREQRLYSVSDYIGCMSPANVEYISRENVAVDRAKIEICPNSIEPKNIIVSEDERNSIRTRYGIPRDKLVLLYGGNLGKPQGVDFIIECLEANADDKDLYFVIAGSGTEAYKLTEYIAKKKETNVIKLAPIDKKEYEFFVQCCDVGLVFLDQRFSIPNFPSRILSYLQASIPILAATDSSTDLGAIIEKEKFGLWAQSGDVIMFNEKLKVLKSETIRKYMGIEGRKYLECNFTAERSYSIIMKHFE